MLSPPGGPGAETCCTYHTFYEGNTVDWQGQSPYCLRTDEWPAGSQARLPLPKCTRCHNPQEALKQKLQLQFPGRKQREVKNRVTLEDPLIQI